MVSVDKYFRPRCTQYSLCLPGANSVQFHGSIAPPHCRVSGVCVEHSQGQWHPDLRRSAYDCLMRMAAAVAGLEATINLALDAVELETAPLVRYSSSTYRSTTLFQYTALQYTALQHTAFQHAALQHTEAPPSFRQTCLFHRIYLK